MRRFRGVLFDLDGTLVKTMEDIFRAWRAVLSDYGIDLKPEDYYPLEGTRVDELAKRLLGIYHLEGTDAEELVRKKEEYYLGNHHFALYMGVEELIELLRAKKVPMAVVTAGLTSRVNSTVPAEFLEKFDVVVTGDETDEGKPSPAPYLRGAEKLGVIPEECIVIENAPLGIESAKSAGAYCIAISTTLDRSYLGRADEVVDFFADIKKSKAIKELVKEDDKVS